MRVFTEEELKKYDGSGGIAYVAYAGKVYDVSRSFHWKKGVHQVTHRAGCDLTDALKQAPHGADMLEKFPIVGEMAEVKNSIIVKQVLARLKQEYGVPEGKPNHAPLSVLVQTILSQNTSDVNSTRAFELLLASFGSWEDVANADIDAIEQAIRCGGLGRVKARRIKQVLKEIERKRGKLELDFLGQLPLSQARDWLEQLPGVGAKTASCVLLFALGMPALPVDTHVLRVAKRLGLISSGQSAVKAHQQLAELVPRQEVYPFHILMIAHGRRVCQARRPLCQGCILKEICPSYPLSVIS